MRALRLASVAWEAERARLGLMARREIRRVVLFLAAGVMATAAFGMLHLVAWIALGPYLGPLGRALAIFGVDVVLALILVMVATRNRPSRAELEALSIRRTALVEARNGVGLSLVPLAFGMMRKMRRRRR
jgi:membrane protease YdiL (CAAX protease family)